MRIFCGGIATETNTFSPIPVGVSAFERRGILRGQYEAEPGNFATTVTRAAQLRRAAESWTVITGLTADAEPGAAVVRSAWEALRDELLEDVTGAPVEMEVVADLIRQTLKG